MYKMQENSYFFGLVVDVLAFGVFTVGRIKLLS